MRLVTKIFKYYRTNISEHIIVCIPIEIYQPEYSFAID